MVKVDLEAFERVGAIVLEPGQNNLRSAVMDSEGRFAYFDTATTPSQVVKVDLTTFELVDALTLGSQEIQITTALMDPTGDFAYFGTNTAPARVVKIDLRRFERVDGIVLGARRGPALLSGDRSGRRVRLLRHADRSGPSGEGTAGTEVFLSARAHRVKGIHAVDLSWVTATLSDNDI